MKIKGGDKGFSHQPVWADADNWYDDTRLLLELMEAYRVRFALHDQMETVTYQLFLCRYEQQLAEDELEKLENEEARKKREKESAAHAPKAVEA